MSRTRNRPRTERTRAERRSRTKRLLVLLIAAALVIPLGATGAASLWGGASEQQAQETPTQEPRAQVDPASQPDPAPTSPPAEPEGTDEQSAAGAEASLVALLDVYGYMMATGDTAYWSEHTSPDCRICAGFIEQTQLLHQMGGYQVDAGMGTGETASEVTGDPPTSAHVEVRIVQESGYLVDDPTLEAQPVYQATGIIAAEMSWDGGQWVVDDMYLQQDPAPGEQSSTGAPQAPAPS